MSGMPWGGLLQWISCLPGTGQKDIDLGQYSRLEVQAGGSIVRVVLLQLDERLGVRDADGRAVLDPVQRDAAPQLHTGRRQDGYSRRRLVWQRSSAVMGTEDWGPQLHRAVAGKMKDSQNRGRLRSPARGRRRGAAPCASPSPPPPPEKNHITLSRQLLPQLSRGLLHILSCSQSALLHAPAFFNQQMVPVSLSSELWNWTLVSSPAPPPPRWPRAPRRSRPACGSACRRSSASAALSASPAAKGEASVEVAGFDTHLDGVSSCDK